MQLIDTAFHPAFNLILFEFPGASRLGKKKKAVALYHAGGIVDLHSGYSRFSWRFSQNLSARL